MRREFLTLPNTLSLLRLFLVVPLIFVMVSSLPNARLWAGFIILLGVATDYFDGVLARKLNCESEWGRILDPLADKVGLGGLAVLLVALGEMPLWFLLAIIVRDLLILAGGLFIKARFKIVLPSIYAGKLTVGILSLTLFLLLIGLTGPVSDALIWLSTAFLVVSFLLYVRRFREFLLSKREDHGTP